MALYCIADLHLSQSGQKPMDIFGAKWQNHIEKLKKGFGGISDSDTVVIAGDLSWGSGSEGCKDDFAFLSSLPGKKIVCKGNHDFWWGTMSNMRRYVKELGITNVDFLHNNAFCVGNVIVCGAKGYLPDDKASAADNARFSEREAGRLELSVKAGLALKGSSDKEIAVFLHYPPAYGSVECAPIIEVINRYRIGRVYYGHIHSSGTGGLRSAAGCAQMRLIAADAVDFTPVLVSTK